MKTRNYLASYNDGHDYGSFEFCSEHRANSKANLADAKKTAQSRFGYRRAGCMRITGTSLYECQ